MNNRNNISNPVPSGGRKAAGSSAVPTREGRDSSCFSADAFASAVSVQAPAFAGEMSGFGAQARASSLASLLRSLANFIECPQADARPSEGGAA
jgi:hypothetical protein